MASARQLSRGVYWDVIEAALTGESFSVEMSLRDCQNIRHYLYNRGKLGVHRNLQPNGNVIVNFNLR